MLDAKLQREALRVAEDAFQRVLDLQTPWGEWDPIERTAEDYREVGRKRRAEQLKQSDRQQPELVRKWNMYRTLLAVETLSLPQHPYTSRLELAYGWATGLICDGWVRPHEAGRRGPDYELRRIRELMDIRHTAQVAIMLIRHGDVDSNLLAMLDNVLDHQRRDGAWPEIVGHDDPELHTVACCVQLLDTLPWEQICEIVPEDAFRNLLRQRCEEAQEDAKRWLETTLIKEWQDLVAPSWVLFRLARYIKRHLPNTAEALVERIRSSLVAPTEAVDYNHQVRMLAAFMSARPPQEAEHSMLVEETLTRLLKRYPRWLRHAADYCVLLQALHLCVPLRAHLQSQRFVDYMADPHHVGGSHRRRLARRILTWCRECASPLPDLWEGTRKGVDHYGEVYHIRVGEIHKLRKSLERIGEKKRAAAIGKRLDNGCETGDFEDLLAYLGGRDLSARTQTKWVGTKRLIYQVWKEAKEVAQILVGVWKR